MSVFSWVFFADFLSQQLGTLICLKIECPLNKGYIQVTEDETLIYINKLLTQSNTHTEGYTNMQTLTTSISLLLPGFLVYGGKYSENTHVNFCAFMPCYFGEGLNSVVFKTEACQQTSKFLEHRFFLKLRHIFVSGGHKPP